MYIHIHIWASLVPQMVKNLPATLETRVRSLGRENLLGEGNANPLGEGNANTSPVFLPGEFHGQGSLADYSPQG